jgi:hypothetical protein
MMDFFAEASNCTNRINVTEKIYRAFGLEIRSDIHLPGLPLGEGAPDVEIFRGTLSDTAGLVSGRGLFFEKNRDSLFLKIPGVAKFLITEGRRIMVDPEEAAAENLIQLLLLTSGIGTVLHQRGGLLFHGSAVSLESGAIAFLGNSSSGKSLLAAALCKQGAQFITDDICRIGFKEDGAPYVYAGFPVVKLWRDSVIALGEAPDALEPMRPGMKRYQFPLKKVFTATETPLKCIFLLIPNNAGKISIAPITGKQKIEKILHYIYHPELCDAARFDWRFMSRLLSLLRPIPVKEISRPYEPFLLDDLVQSVINECSL